MTVNDAITTAIRAGYDEVHVNSSCVVCISRMGWSRDMVTIEDQEQYSDIAHDGKILDIDRDSEGITINGVPVKKWKDG